MTDAAPLQPQPERAHHVGLTKGALDKWLTFCPECSEAAQEWVRVEACDRQSVKAPFELIDLAHFQTQARIARNERRDRGVYMVEARELQRQLDETAANTLREVNRISDERDDLRRQLDEAREKIAAVAAVVEHYKMIYRVSGLGATDFAVVANVSKALAGAALGSPEPQGLSGRAAVTADQTTVKPPVGSPEPQPEPRGPWTCTPCWFGEHHRCNYPSVRCDCKAESHGVGSGEPQPGGKP